MSRAVQGIGAAFMMPATLSIITNAFPAHERGKAIGTWAGVSALALAIGPVVGGFLTEQVSWRAIFFLNLPVAVAAVVVTLFAAEESRDPTVAAHGRLRRRRRRSPSASARSCWRWSRATTGAGARRASSRCSPLSVVGPGRLRRSSSSACASRWSSSSFFRSRTFLGTNGIAFVVSFAMLAMFFFMALYMQNILGYSPLEAGIRFLPSTVVIIVTAPLAGRLTDRIGAQLPIAVGLTLVAIALYMQSRDHGRHELRLPPAPLLADGPRDRPHDVADVDRRDELGRHEAKAGVASGILSMSRMVGGTFGVAAVGALFQHLSDNRLQSRARRPPAELAAAGLVHGQPRLRRRRTRTCSSSTPRPRSEVGARAEGHLRALALDLAEALDRGRRGRAS